MNIIVGLGNPGEKYQKTRHNIGFLALDYLATIKRLDWKTDKKFNALTAKDGDTLYVKPLTFMNNSGICVRAVMSYYNLLPKKLGIMKQRDADLSSVLTVIHDEIDIEFGKMKLSENRGAAGHNGIKSIIAHLKTKNFKRYRIGINGERHQSQETKDYVLTFFSKNEIEILNNEIFPKITAD